MSRLRKSVFALAGIVIGSLMALSLAELALRIFGQPEAPVIGWSSTAAESEKNEFGFRGHRKTGNPDLTLVLAGDSQVEGLGSLQEMPEAFLASSMKSLTGRETRVPSIAAAGWGQDQQLLALERWVPEIRPKALILWLTPKNDLWNNTFPTHFPEDGWPKPTFWLEDGALRGPNVAWLARYEPPGLRLAWALRPAGMAAYPRDGDWERKLPPAYPFQSASGRSAKSLREFLAERYGVPVRDLEMFDGENFRNEKTHFSIFLVPRSPRLEYSARLTRLLLLKIHELCEHNGARFFVLVTEDWGVIPSDPTLFDVGGQLATLSSSAAEELLNEILANVPIVRIRTLDPSMYVSRKNHHLNGKGNAFVMKELSLRLAQEL